MFEHHSGFSTVQRLYGCSSFVMWAARLTVEVALSVMYLLLASIAIGFISDDVYWRAAGLVLGAGLSCFPSWMLQGHLIGFAVPRPSHVYGAVLAVQFLFGSASLITMLYTTCVYGIDDPLTMTLDFALSVVSPLGPLARALNLGSDMCGAASDGDGM